MRTSSDAIAATWIAFAVVVLAALPARAQQAPGPSPALARGKRIAVLPFDALGVNEARVIKLESLFRNELNRLAGKTGPTRRTISAVVSRGTLSRCTGETRCLAQIGQRLGVDFTVSGNVAALGDSYVVNIKVINVAKRAELGRIASDPLRGNPDELIEAVRVAAYRLLAPERLTGSITLLADVEGATVILDGKIVGTTPLRGGLVGLVLGKHKLSVTKEGYSTFADAIDVRFQKTTSVVVRLATGSGAASAGVKVPVQGPVRESSPPWYKSTWFIVGVSVGAVVVGGVVGWQLGKDTVVDCTGGACGP